MRLKGDFVTLGRERGQTAEDGLESDRLRMVSGFSVQNGRIS